ncbi:hypothetical protein [Luteolibacter marinus]|uniref:hypothetical protein n=1 Tax=Luteolibacter marinus TaxID=2776705 RepID=UPI00186751BC|nr:hypothetical protein [Luteolibacter marinus]
MFLVTRRGAGFAPPVRWLERIERRLEWLHFPGLFKYLTFLGVIAYACQWANKDIGYLLDFDREKVFAGEVWRVVTFLFTPMGLRSFGPVGVFFLFIAVQIAFLISDSMESAWGPTRVTLYILLAFIGLLVSNFLFPHAPPVSGSMLYTSMFFAFATLFPKVEFMIFFLFPVQVRILAAIGAVLLLLNCLGNPAMLAIVVPAMIPYALWVLPDVIHGRKSLVKAAQRRRKFNVDSKPEGTAFHHCEVCHRTERDPEDLEFFVMPDGKEYCKEHLPPQA